jgi:ATP-dependent RNA helicase DHX8/PRP22
MTVLQAESMCDKTLAEFILSVASQNTSFDSFKQSLVQNGAEFDEKSFETMYQLVNGHEVPKKA